MSLLYLVLKFLFLFFYLRYLSLFRSGTSTTLVKEKGERGFWVRGPNPSTQTASFCNNVVYQNSVGTWKEGSCWKDHFDLHVLSQINIHNDSFLWFSSFGKRLWKFTVLKSTHGKVLLPINWRKRCSLYNYVFYHLLMIVNFVLQCPICIVFTCSFHIIFKNNFTHKDTRCNHVFWDTTSTNKRTNNTVRDFDEKRGQKETLWTPKKLVIFASNHSTLNFKFHNESQAKRFNFSKQKHVLENGLSNSCTKNQVIPMFSLKM